MTPATHGSRGLWVSVGLGRLRVSAQHRPMACWPAAVAGQVRAHEHLSCGDRMGPQNPQGMALGDSVGGAGDSGGKAASPHTVNGRQCVHSPGGRWTARHHAGASRCRLMHRLEERRCHPGAGMLDAACGEPPTLTLHSGDYRLAASVDAPAATPGVDVSGLQPLWRVGQPGVEGPPHPPRSFMGGGPTGLPGDVWRRSPSACSRRGRPQCLPQPPDSSLIRWGHSGIAIIPYPEYHRPMAWEVEVTDQFQEWWHTLDEEQQDAVTIKVSLLQELGPTLGSPHSSDIKGSRHGRCESFAHSTRVGRYGCSMPSTPGGRQSF